MNTQTAEQNPLDCFQGGEDGVLKRASDAVIEAIGGTPKRTLVNLTRVLGLEPDTLDDLYSQEKHLDLPLLRKIRRPLGVRPEQILGDPNLQDEQQREYWAAEMERSPYSIAAFEGCGSEEEARNEASGMQLENYIKLRGIEVI